MSELNNTPEDAAAREAVARELVDGFKSDPERANEATNRWFNDPDNADKRNTFSPADIAEDAYSRADLWSEPADWTMDPLGELDDVYTDFRGNMPLGPIDEERLDKLQAVVDERFPFDPMAEIDIPPLIEPGPKTDPALIDHDPLADDPNHPPQ